MEYKLQYSISEMVSSGVWEQRSGQEFARFDDYNDAKLYVASLANEVLKGQDRGKRPYVGFGPSVLSKGVIIESGHGDGIWVSCRRTGYKPRGVTTRHYFGRDVMGAAACVLQALAEPGR